VTNDQGVAFLTALSCKQIKIKGNGWVEASCPLAPWLHKSHSDQSPSFGIHIKSGERSHFLCFACRQGTLEELLHTLEFYSKSNHIHQYNFSVCHKILDEELEVVPLPPYVEFQQSEQVFEEWPSYWIDSFKPVVYFSDAMKYLGSRGVSAETITEHNLRYDSKRYMIVAPYYNAFFKFAGARGRSILPDVSGPQKHFDYSFHGTNNCKLVWYGETVLNQPGPVVVAEGQFDAMRIKLAYSKVVANLTAKPSWEKMKKLGDCPFIIQIPDNDEAGAESVKAYASMCHNLGIGHKVLHLDLAVKDAAECSPLYLKDMIEELL
jgi:hypothetical protein